MHACHRDQVRSVWERWWADADEPLVALVIDSARLDSPWEEVEVGGETWPHIRGPVNRQAVVEVRPVGRGGALRSFATTYFTEIALRAVALLAVMLLAFGAARVAQGLTSGAWPPFVAAVLAVLVGAALTVRWFGRRA